MRLPILNDRDKAGIIRAFEFTFEQSWKAIQKIAWKQGVEVASPKKAFAFAIKASWIKNEDESSYIQLIADRNLTTHTYEGKLIDLILERIEKDHLPLFKKLFSNLEKEIYL